MKEFCRIEPDVQVCDPSTSSGQAATCSKELRTCLAGRQAMNRAWQGTTIGITKAGKQKLN